MSPKFVLGAAEWAMRGLGLIESLTALRASFTQLSVEHRNESERGHVNVTATRAFTC